MSTDIARRKAICAVHLMEADWQEGFVCDLPTGHTGPHRNQGGWDEVNESTDETGRRYRWVYEWTWADEQ